MMIVGKKATFRTLAVGTQVCQQFAFGEALYTPF